MSSVVSVPGRAVPCLITKIRDKTTKQAEFVQYSDRLMRLVVEEGLAHLPTVKSKLIETPCGPFDGMDYGPLTGLCAVSIVRSGNALLEAVRQVLPSISVGHVLVQRDEGHPDKKPIFFYQKFPSDISERTVLLVDPILATGGSALAAMDCLVKAGVSPAKTIFLNIISAPEGIQALHKAYPDVTIVCAQIDPILNEHKFIIPGLGDFGDRYYNTTNVAEPF
eukprot:GEMP01032476.1.p1 GENE.GEMP01032476.1~~GEMP01032476.1.p1  ORF type:complete len:222 (+),score=38.58 GEMP01032476.1:35-700(+)